MIKHLASSLLLGLLTLLTLSATTREYLFTPIANINGDNRVRGIMQLTDGRILTSTITGIEIYDGSGFSVFPFPTDSSTVGNLSGYNGHQHLYTTVEDDRLWIKNYRSLRCLDLRTGIYLNVDSLLSIDGITGAHDFFADGHRWISTGDSIVSPSIKCKVATDSAEGDVLDIAAIGEKLFVFYLSGKVTCIHYPTGEIIYSTMAFPAEELEKFHWTSLVVPHSGSIYQLRNGTHGGLFRLNAGNGEWEKLLETDFVLNTLTIGNDGTVYISCPQGILTINPATGERHHLTTLRTRSGSVLATEISTIFSDNDGALWLGTVSRGMLYHHPDAYVHTLIPASELPLASAPVARYTPGFAEDVDGNIFIGNRNVTVDSTGVAELRQSTLSPRGIASEYGSDGAFVSSDGTLFFADADGCHIFSRRKATTTPEYPPIITDIYIHGNEITPESGLIKELPAYTDTLILDYDQNFITIECAAMNYINPATTKFSYRLDGIDDRWTTVAPRNLTENGRLRAVYTSLPPGNYRFKVKAGTGDDHVKTVYITIRPPWWDTTWAKITWVVLALAIIGLGIKLFNIRTRRKLERRHREEILLTRIRSLIEQCDRYEAERNLPETAAPAANEQSPADAEFIARAVSLVEKNLNTPGYSVEQLSRDLCMERTGLYRKLTSMLDRSPSLFIRDIRLRHAATLIKAGELSMTEIAERTGFSSSSYMSRCFQETYGCRPTEYASRY